MQVKGTIKKIDATIQVSEKYSKRELVVETEGQYPQPILIQFSQDKCAILDLYKVGDSVEVDINLRGREWTSPQGEVRYFNTVEGWKMNKVGQQQVQAPTLEEQSLNDDLPF